MTFPFRAFIKYSLKDDCKGNRLNESACLLVGGRVRIVGTSVGRGREGRLRRLSSFLKSSAARHAMPSVRASKMVFEPLEPRLMLNADLAISLAAVDPTHATHDVVIRLVEETSTVATATVSQNRVEVIDQADPSRVLASGAEPEISQLSIANGAAADRSPVDVASFAGHQAPGISIAGGGAGTLALSTDQAATWTVDGHE